MSNIYFQTLEGRVRMLELGEHGCWQCPPNIYSFTKSSDRAMLLDVYSQFCKQSYLSYSPSILVPAFDIASTQWDVFRNHSIRSASPLLHFEALLTLSLSRGGSPVISIPVVYSVKNATISQFLYYDLSDSPAEFWTRFALSVDGWRTR
jgi:hypothetical protein